VREEMLQLVTNLEERKWSKYDKNAFVGEKRVCHDFVPVGDDGSDVNQNNIQNYFKRKPKQSYIKSSTNKKLRDSVCRAIARFLYANAIPFNVVRTDEFREMFDEVIMHGKGFEPPSYHEVRVKYLKEEVKTTKDAMEEHRAEWEKTGCTIMTDGWTDKKRRMILNFLVNNPKGTVFLKSVDASNISKTTDKIFKLMDDIVEEVGEDNVVQIVTDNATNYKAAGEMLMNKRKRQYWTPCATHCVDLMLEAFEKKILVHAVTIPKGTKIATFIYSRTYLICLLKKFTKGRDLV
jgi:hypothetical protein